jgi:hypothetical protein
MDKFNLIIWSIRKGRKILVKHLEFEGSSLTFNTDAVEDLKKRAEANGWGNKIIYQLKWANTKLQLTLTL